MTTKEFIQKHNLTMKPIAVGQHVVDGKTPFKWLVFISYGQKTFNVDFTTGAANVHRYGCPLDYSSFQKQIKWNELRGIQPVLPKLERVLDCLQLDCQSVIDAPL